MGAMLSMMDKSDVSEDVNTLTAEIQRLHAEVEELTRANDVLRSEINFLKRAAEYFYKESLDARR